MARIRLLDAGPLGLACSRPGLPLVARCQACLSALEVAGADVNIPAIADYEVRRELLRLGARVKIRNLDALCAHLGRLAIAEEAWAHAAAFWAIVRRGGLPTAGAEDLDADAILAGMANTVGQPGDVVTIATTNVRHLARFPGIDAQLWTAIS